MVVVDLVVDEAHELLPAHYPLRVVHRARLDNHAIGARHDT